MSKVEGIASPTALLEEPFSILIIGVYEERGVATFDAHRAYLRTKMPEGKTILLKLRGRFYIPCVI